MRVVNVGLHSRSQKYGKKLTVLIMAHMRNGQDALIVDLTMPKLTNVIVVVNILLIRILKSNIKDIAKIVIKLMS